MSEWIKHAGLPDIRGRFVKKFGDGRGHFMVPYVCDQTFPKCTFVQDNVSVSDTYVFRGLHFQHKRPQGKLITVIQGAIIDFFMDLRRDSTTYGEWGFWPMGNMFEYPDKTIQLFIPEGFAHGFLAMKPDTIFLYKVTDHYCPEDKYTLKIDQMKGIEALLEEGRYPSIEEMIISDKDKAGMTLEELEMKNILF